MLTPYYFVQPSDHSNVTNHQLFVDDIAGGGHTTTFNVVYCDMICKNKSMNQLENPAGNPQASQF